MVLLLFSFVLGKDQTKSSLLPGDWLYTQGILNHLQFIQISKIVKLLDTWFFKLPFYRWENIWEKYYIIHWKTSTKISSEDWLPQSPVSSHCWGLSFHLACDGSLAGSASLPNCDKVSVLSHVSCSDLIGKLMETVSGSFSSLTRIPLHEWNSICLFSCWWTTELFCLCLLLLFLLSLEFIFRTELWGHR